MLPGRGRTVGIQTPLGRGSAGGRGSRKGAGRRYGERDGKGREGGKDRKNRKDREDRKGGQGTLESCRGAGRFSGPFSSAVRSDLVSQAGGRKKGTAVFSAGSGRADPSDLSVEDDRTAAS